MMIISVALVIAVVIVVVGVCIVRRYVNIDMLVVSPVRSTYGGYYGLVGVPPPRPRPRPPRPPRPQTLHRSHDNLQNPYRIASIFYM